MSDVQNDPGGNAIVTPPGTDGGSGSTTLPFPVLALAAVIVGAGIYAVDRVDNRAAWLLAFLILLTIAFKYPSFGNELSTLLGASKSNQQNANAPTTQGNTGNISNVVQQAIGVPNLG
jgi:hypothetical protein